MSRMSPINTFFENIMREALHDLRFRSLVDRLTTKQNAASHFLPVDFGSWIELHYFRENLGSEPTGTDWLTELRDYSHQMEH